MSNKKQKSKMLAQWFLIRLPIIFGIIIIIMMGALKLVERYPDPLREGFEEYLTNLSGANATIGKLEKITFIPNFTIDLSDVTMHDKSNAAVIGVEIEKLYASAPFWSVMIGGGHIIDLQLRNLKAMAGQMTPQEIHLETVNIEDKEGPNQYGSFLIVSGTYGGSNLLLEAEIKKLKKGYDFGDEIPFSITVGESRLSATLVQGWSKLSLISAVFEKGDKKSLAQDYVFVKSKNYQTNNPLSCLFFHGDDKECNIYLDKKGFDTK